MSDQKGRSVTPATTSPQRSRGRVRNAGGPILSIACRRAANRGMSWRRWNGTYVMGIGYMGNPVGMEARACSKSMMSEFPYPCSSLFGIVLD